MENLEGDKVTILTIGMRAHFLNRTKRHWIMTEWSILVAAGGICNRIIKVDPDDFAKRCILWNRANVKMTWSPTAQWMSEDFFPFASGGDSGSLVYAKENNVIVPFNWAFMLEPQTRYLIIAFSYAWRLSALKQPKEGWELRFYEEYNRAAHFNYHRNRYRNRYDVVKFNNYLAFLPDLDRASRLKEVRKSIIRKSSDRHAILRSTQAIWKWTTSPSLADSSHLR